MSENHTETMGDVFDRGLKLRRREVLGAGICTTARLKAPTNS